jgi:hypothetical protein
MGIEASLHVIRPERWAVIAARPRVLLREHGDRRESLLSVSLGKRWDVLHWCLTGQRERASSALSWVKFPPERQAAWEGLGADAPVGVIPGSSSARLAREIGAVADELLAARVDVAAMEAAGVVRASVLEGWQDEAVAEVLGLRRSVVEAAVVAAEASAPIVVWRV